MQKRKKQLQKMKKKLMIKLKDNIKMKQVNHLHLNNNLFNQEYKLCVKIKKLMKIINL
jgi:uncharacterized protein YxjI